MAPSLLTWFATPALLVLGLYTTTTLALKCYGCYQIGDPATSVGNIPKCDRPTIVSRPNQHALLGAATGAFRDLIATGDVLEMRKGPYCMEIRAEDTSGKPYILRSMIADAPQAKFLDKFGCVEGICFCKKSRCNIGINQAPELRDTGRIKLL